MGAKSSTIRMYKKKFANRRNNIQKYFNRFRFDLSAEDAALLLPPNHPYMLDMELTHYIESQCDPISTEICQMRTELSDRIQHMRVALDNLEVHHNQLLDECAKRSRNAKPPKGSHPPILGDPLLEEARLKHAIIMETLRNGDEQVCKLDDGPRVPKRTEPNEVQKKSNSFLRQMLFKSAKRQFKKNRLNEAIESFYQLVVATNGQFCAEESWLLFDVCSQKISGIYDFYHQIGNVVRGMDPNSTGYITNELWASVVDDMRNECSDMHDVLMGIKVEVAEPLEESCVVEKLKYLTTLKVTALWLQITPMEHEEFDDIKDMFFDALNKDVDAFANLVSFDKNNTRAANVFHTVIEELYTKYPIVAQTRKLQKVAAKILNRKPDAIPYTLKGQ
ncbi:hypothetical protein M3Y97_00747100 [Aphelenchoides bicaudatus]|nr:hypothetical protein M3Y97_00747100 [Aphelenchoides bicaudatus]